MMTWAHQQPWSNGDTAMTGASYMGITQIFAAAGRPPGLKAIFPQVPGADVYRDVVASGGQIDVGFIPLWLGLVTGDRPDPAGRRRRPTRSPAIERARSTTWRRRAPSPSRCCSTRSPAASRRTTGRSTRERSPINVIDKVDVPTFFVGGEYDLFQRGTPLLFENLQQARRARPR